jgi:hypothetical protein
VIRGEAEVSATDIRPMSLGEVLDRTFSLYKNNFLLLAGIMAVPMLLKLAVTIGAEWFTRSAIATAGANPAVRPQYLTTFYLTALGAGLIDFVLRSASQGGTIVAVSEIYLGRKPTVAESYRPVRRKLLRLILLIFVTALVCILGFIFLIIPGIIILCKTAVVTPVMMLEDEGVGGSLSRSWELTKGFGFQILLIFLLVFVIQWVVGMILLAPVTIAVAVMKLKVIPLGLAVLQHIGRFLTEVLIGPLGTIAFSLMYYNLRVRKEAFDLQHLMTSLEGPAGPSDAPSLA